MKKKFAIIAVVLVAAITCSLFVACSDDTEEKPHKHDLQHFATIIPTCTKDGNIEYWYCEDCGKYFSDPAATKEISKAETVTAAKGHTYQDHVCTKCGAVEGDFVTAGLEYTLLSNDTYEVSGVGSAKNEQIINIPSTYLGKKVTAIGDLAFSFCNSLTHINIPDSVTNIGTGAFGRCEALASVNIPYGVTEISDMMFYGCTALTDITIHDNVQKIGEAAFVECALKSIVIPKNVVSIGAEAFIGCRFLEEIIVENGNSAYNSAGNCLIETNSRTLIQGSRTSIIPKDGSVTSIAEEAFVGISSLESITIPECITDIGAYAFRNCDTLGVIYCEAASKPSGWDENWSAEENISSSGHYPVVWNCNSNDVADDGNIYYSQDGINYSLKDGRATVIKQIKSLTGEIILPQTIEYNGILYSITSISGDAFKDCNITNIVIPDSVTSIGDCAFSGCSGLASITIPNSVTSIGWQAFSDCDSLENINVEKGNAVYHSVGNCIIETASKTLIAGCKNSLIPDDGSVTSIGRSAFYGCSGLTSITIPDSVTSIGDGAFNGCRLLKEVHISDLKAWCNIEYETYVGSLSANCNPLSNGAALYLNGECVVHLVIPEGITNINNWAFNGCNSFESITLSDGVESISGRAFSQCTSLKSITIPSSVNYIGILAFAGSPITNLTFQGTMQQWQTIEKESLWANLSNITTITCTDGVLDSEGNLIS